MKKRGFTLIELLAVIVVLAIIALIATPIVMNVIKKASVGAAERSADNYIKAVETLIATEKLDGTPVADGTYTIGTDGNLDFGDVEVSGTKPVGGKLTITNGQVDKSKTEITYSDYTVKFSNGKAEASEKGAALILCTAVKTPTSQQLFNTENGEMKSDEVGVQATSDAPYALGSEYTCTLGEGVTETFYVLKEDGDKVKLLMNENLVAQVTWEEENKSDWIVESNEYLASQTAGWTTLLSADGKVELPSYDDINAVAGLDWMRSNIDCMTTNGYWTYNDFEDTDLVWGVIFDGMLQAESINTFSYYGVRPVITISKANMSL